MNKSDAFNLVAKAKKSLREGKVTLAISQMEQAIRAFWFLEDSANAERMEAILATWKPE